MARKDVELVIRAKDEAAKAVNAITAAIDALVGSQDDLGKSAGKSDNALTRLGGAVAELDKKLKGLTVAGRISQELDKATAASARLEKGLAETAAEASRLASEAKEAAVETARLGEAMAKAAANVAKEQAALKAAKKAAAELNDKLRESTAERDKAARADARLTAEIAKQEARVASAAERYRVLASEIAGMTAPTQTFQNKVAAANKALDEQTAKLDRLKAKQAEARATVQSAGDAISKFAADAAKAGTGLEKQTAALTKAKAEYAELKAAARSAAEQQKTLDAAADQSANALERQAAALERSQAEMAQLAAAAGKADAAMAELATGSAAILKQSFDAQRRAMLETKREWVALTAEAKKLSGEMVKIGPPTREQAAAFNQITTAARAAKQSYDLQAQGLHQLSGIMRQTGGDVDQLRAREQAFVGVMSQVDAGLDRIQQEAIQTAAAYQRLTQASGQAARGTREVAGPGSVPPVQPVNRLADAYKRLYGETRLAMSWTQRLRGEVLSLVSAYGGIYGVINLLRQAITAYQTLEAATSRLNVVFDGNSERTAEELDFLRRNADRLGITFGDLAQEYSKFSIATQGTNLEGAKTRKIFISVAEAARVNKTSMEQMKGVFTALTQIVSKGAVQMEELRQQLGDRLPGALQFMADGLNVTTAELIKMMEQGLVTSDALIGFAEELDERFGPQLGAALKTTTTELGKFQNAAFQALVTFGNGGFIESFTDLLRTMTEVMQSADFEAFIRRMSAAFGLLTDVIGVAVENFDILFIAMTAFVGIKLTPFIVGIGAAFANLRNVIRPVQGDLFATTTAMRTAGTAAGAFSVALGRLTLAIRGLMSATGVGLLVTAISIGIGAWATSADSATEALNGHRKIVDAVKNAYDKAGGSVENWADTIKETTFLQAKANLDALRIAAKELRESLAVSGAGFTAGQSKGLAREQFEALRDLQAEFVRTGGSVDDYKAKIASIGDKAATENVREYALALLESADGSREMVKGLTEAEAVVAIFNGTATEAQEQVLGLRDASEEAAATIGGPATEATQDWLDVLEEINNLIPSINDNLEEMKRTAELDEAFAPMARAARTMSELNGLIGQYNDAVETIQGKSLFDAVVGSKSGVDAAAALLRQFEQFRAEPYIDWTMRNGQRVNSGLRAGFGSDTVTLADGTIKKVVDGMRVSVADANRDLVRRIGEFNNRIAGQIGVDRFASFSPQQQGVLTSIAYNYGELPERIVEAVRSGSTAEIAKAIRALAGDNSGVNRDRRNNEAFVFENGQSRQIIDAQVAAQEAADEKTIKAAEDRLAKAKEFHEQQAANIAQQQFELSLEDQALVKRETAKAIRDAENEAIKAGTVLTDAERQKIAEITEAKFRKQQIEEETNATKQAAVEAEQRVNDLLTQQTELQRQIALYKQQGDTEAVKQAEIELQNINTQLLAAINNATAMWEAVGGSNAVAKIATLKTAALEAANLARQGQQSFIDWQRVGQLFATGLANAFDRFAQAVAEGKSIGEAAKEAFLQFAADFLRQVAQMIIQQAILNMMRSFFPGFGGVGIGAGHTGGVVGSRRIGSGNATRRVDPAIFAGAPRFHAGYTPGLRPGELPAILKRNEEVLTRDDPRHALNGGLSPAGGGAGPTVNFKNVNAIDAPSFLEVALASPVGEKVFLNWISANPQAVRAALGT